MHNKITSLAKLEKIMEKKWRRMLTLCGFDPACLTGEKAKCPLCGSEGTFLFLKDCKSGYGGCDACGVKGDGFELMKHKFGDLYDATAFMLKQLRLRGHITYDDRDSHVESKPAKSGYDALHDLQRKLLNFGHPLTFGGKALSKTGRWKASDRCVWGRRAVERSVWRAGVLLKEWMLVGENGLVVEYAHNKAIVVITSLPTANEVISELNPGRPPLVQGECLAFVTDETFGAFDKDKLLLRLGLYKNIFNAGSRASRIADEQLVIRQLKEGANHE